jgi:flavin reductase (DIM6/NTAB) family NADH-FMN oxidoreductase RutF
MHRVIEPRILYFGTPVVLISTVNEDGTPNLAPMSSAWWLNQSCVLGMSSRSKTIENLKRTGECVLNLPSSDLVGAVDRLALLTGKYPVPEYKARMGYRYQPDKFAAAMLTPEPADLVDPPRVAECPVQLEARVEQVHALSTPDDHLVAVEARVIRVHIEESLLVPGHRNYIDPERWNPLIMSFTEFFGLSGKVHPSRLATVYSPPRDQQTAISHPAQPAHATHDDR